VWLSGSLLAARLQARVVQPPLRYHAERRSRYEPESYREADLGLQIQPRLKTFENQLASHLLLLRCSFPWLFEFLLSSTSLQVATESKREERAKYTQTVRA
jgi:hypothetical protein